MENSLVEASNRSIALVLICVLLGLAMGVSLFIGGLSWLGVPLLLGLMCAGLFVVTIPVGVWLGVWMSQRGRG